MHQTRIVIAALAITIGAAAAPAHAGKGPAVLASLPDDTTMLLSIDMKKFLAAPIVAEAVDMLKAQAATELAEMKAVGIDVEKDVSKVFIAIAGGGISSVQTARLKILVAEGKFKLDSAALADKNKTHEGVTYWSTPEVDIALIGKRLFVVADGHMPEVIDVVKGKAKNAVKSSAAKTLRSAIGATTVTHAGWAVGVVSDSDRQAMGAQGKDMDWFSASTALRKEAVDVAVRLGMTSATTAKDFADQTNASIGSAAQTMSTVGLADFAKSLNVGANGSIVAIAASVTKKEIATISSMLSMMGAMGSGSGSAPPSKGP